MDAKDEQGSHMHGRVFAVYVPKGSATSTGYEANSVSGHRNYIIILIKIKVVKLQM